MMKILASAILVVTVVASGVSAQPGAGTGTDRSGSGTATVAPPSEATVGDLTRKALWTMIEAEKRLANVKDQLGKLQETIKTWGQKVASNDDIKTARAGTAAIRSGQEDVVLAASVALGDIRSLEAEIRVNLLPRLIAAQDGWEKVKAQPGISTEYAARIQRSLDKNQKNIADVTAQAAKLKGYLDTVEGLDLPQKSDIDSFEELGERGAELAEELAAFNARLGTTVKQIAKILPPKT